MKHLIATTLYLLFFIGPAVVADDLDEQLTASRTAAKTFASNLKGELQAALKQGGAINGIAVCNEKAMDIADATSQELGLQIGRTSLKVRNPDNAADDWERDVLARFETRKENGEPVAALEHYEVVESGGRQTFRYMRAIPTAKVCLACHGESLSPELSAKLDELYPEDDARGFKEGDIRGAFTVSKPM